MNQRQLATCFYLLQSHFIPGRYSLTAESQLGRSAHTREGEPDSARAAASPPGGLRVFLISHVAEPPVPADADSFMGKCFVLW